MQKGLAKTSTYRWKYVALPLLVLVLSLALTAMFYGRLPDEVAYRFTRQGEPGGWLDRNILILFMLVPQIVMTLMAMGIIGLITRLGVLSQAENAWIKPEKVTLFMGNAFGLPQAILFFIMLDIFSYNSYHVHIIPTWLFLVVMLVLATFALGALFFLVVSRARQSMKS